MSIQSWSRRATFAVVAVCTALLPALFSAPAASAHEESGSTHHTWFIHAGLESRDHAIQVMAFSPSELWINAGDTVVWNATSAEPHTITFTATGAPPPQPFTESPVQVTRSGGSVFKPATFMNSGLLTNLNPGAPFPVYRSYSLKFNDLGSFTYSCWIHGPMMSGVIHVRAAGTAYPHTQRFYDRQAAHLQSSRIREGRKLAEETEENATNHLIFVGVGNDQVDVMRFIRQDVTIKVGESVKFVNLSFGPHTVNIGPEIAPPPVPVGDPTHFNGTGSLGSGFLFHEQSFTITFTKEGDYNIFCALHDFMGMVGVVHVEDDVD